MVIMEGEDTTYMKVKIRKTPLNLFYLRFMVLIKLTSKLRGICLWQKLGYLLEVKKGMETNFVGIEIFVGRGCGIEK